MNDNNVIYEVKKELSISKIMQLIDLNGSKKNFQSEFILEIVDPNKKVNICVLNQDELDNGKINFEETERGKYSRRVTYQNNKHINHYIAIKKHMDDNDDKNVDCVLVIHMKELPPIINEEIDNANNADEEYELNSNIPNNTKEDIRKTLYKLRDDKTYNNISDEYNESKPKNKTVRFTDESQNIQNVSNNIDIDDTFNESSKSNNSKESRYFMNSYFFIGIIFLVFFGYFFYKKKIKK
jgi:hypothetical protein